MTQIAVKPQVAARSASQAGRLDIYAGVHKGLRAFMTDTLVAVGRMDAHDPAEVDRTLTQVRELLEACRVHLNAENQFLHPAMEMRRPGSAGVTARDHGDQAQVFEQLEADARAVERAQPGAPMRLYHGLALFVAENLSHMHVEETENNATLWASYSDEELAEIHHAIVASLRPETMAAFMRWIIPALSPVERAGLLTGIRLGAPREVLDRLLAIAQPHLSERDWGKLMAALGPLPVFG